MLRRVDWKTRTDVSKARIAFLFSTKLGIFDCLTLKMKAQGAFETLFAAEKSVLREIPENLTVPLDDNTVCVHVCVTS